MTDQEKQLLIADIKAEVIKELTGQDLRVANAATMGTRALKEIYDKYRGPLYDRFGNVTWAQVWDCARKLAVFKMGHRYVRDLLPSEEQAAAEFAEKIIKELLNLEG